MKTTMPLAVASDIPALSSNPHTHGAPDPRFSIGRLCRKVVVGCLWLALGLLFALWLVVLGFAETAEQKVTCSWVALILAGMLGGLLWILRHHQVLSVFRNARRSNAPRPPFTVRNLCRTIAIRCFQLMIGLLLLVWISVVVVANNKSTKANLSFDFFSILGGLGSVIHAPRYRQRWAAARATTQQRPAAAPEPLPQSGWARCRSLTRGTGELQLDQDGSLHFVPQDKFRVREWIIFGDIDPRTPSIWQLIFGAGQLRRQAEGHRSLTIRRSQLRAAMAFDRLVLGPSMVVGYSTPDRAGLQCEEFFFSDYRQAQQCFAEPTANAEAWVQALALGSITPTLRRELTRYRKQVHRRLRLASGVLAGGIMTAFYLVFFLVIVLAIFANPGKGSVGMALAIALGCWLGCYLVAGLVAMFTW